MSEERSDMVMVMDRLRPAWLRGGQIVSDTLAVFERFEDQTPGSSHFIKVAATLDGLMYHPRYFEEGPAGVVKQTYRTILNGSVQMFPDENVFWLPEDLPGVVIKKDFHSLATTSLLCMSALPQIVGLETDGYVIDPVRGYWAADSTVMGEGVLVMEHVRGAVDYDDAPPEVQTQMWRASMDVGHQFEAAGIPVITDFNKEDVLWRGTWQGGKPVLAVVDLGVEDTERAILSR